MTIDFFEVAEELKPTESTPRFDFDKLYSRLVLKDNTPAHGCFLTDFNRGIRIKSHWNPEKKCKDICNDHYKKKCLRCNPENKKDKDFASIDRTFLFWNLDRIGIEKESEKGSKYTEDPLCLATITSGSSGINFQALIDANCEHADFGDPWDFYDEREGRRYVNKESLANCYLMYTESGKDKLWQLRKIKSDKGKVSYPEPKVIAEAKVKQNLGRDVKLAVPKDVRNYADNLDASELLRFVLVHYGNVDWEAFGLTQPAEGDKFVPLGFERAKVDAAAEL